jgi:hypothetical protein
MNLKRVDVKGMVSRSVRNAASKSAHEAVVLTAEDGDTYVLRERDANPFEPSGFEGALGQEICASGIAAPDGTLIVDRWCKLK